jgi:hypothetical protein
VPLCRSLQGITTPNNNSVDNRFNDLDYISLKISKKTYKVSFFLTDKTDVTDRRNSVYCIMHHSTVVMGCETDGQRIWVSFLEGAGDIPLSKYPYRLWGPANFQSNKCWWLPLQCKVAREWH